MQRVKVTKDMVGMKVKNTIQEMKGPPEVSAIDNGVMWPHPGFPHSALITAACPAACQP